MIVHNSFINKPVIRDACFYCLYSVAFFLRLPPEILERSRGLFGSFHVVFPLGFLYWFMALKFGLKVPNYNVSKYLCSESEEKIVINFIEKYYSEKNSFFLNKQIFLLKKEKVNSLSVTNYISKKISQHFKKNKKTQSKQHLKFDKNSAFLALDDISRVFKINHLSMFLVSGTLLGCIRDNSFVDGEYDIDIGFFIDEIKIEKLYELIMSTGKFKLGHKTDYMIQVVHHSNIMIDIFAHFNQGNLVFHGSSTHHWYNTNFSLKEVIFNNRSFLIPDDFETYLEENYGNWKDPVVFWFYSFDTPNQVYPQTIDALFFLVEIILNSNDRFKVDGALKRLKSSFNIDFTKLLPSQEPAEIVKPLLAFRRAMIVDCFDDFNYEQFNIIKKAQKLGEFLYVGVFSDKAFYAIHGRYAKYNINQRMEMVKQINGVDEVFIIEIDCLTFNDIKKFNVSVVVVKNMYKPLCENFSDKVKMVYV